MISWLVDNSTFVLLLLIFTAIALAVGWWLNRKLWFILSVIPICVLAIVILLLSTYYVTDQMRLRQAVEEMAKAIEQRNVDGFFARVSESFNHATMNKKTFRDYVDHRLKKHKITRFGVRSFNYGEISRPAKGEIDFLISAEGSWEDVLALRCFAEFVLEDQWRLKGFKLQVAATRQDFHLPAGRF